jgi:hypothetical protein
MSAELQGFEVFRRPRRRGRQAGNAALTVVERGDILLTSRARALLGHDVTHVALASEGRPASRIALVPITVDTPIAQRYRLSPNGKGAGGRVGARAFVREREVPPGRFDVELEDGMLVAVVR